MPLRDFMNQIESYTFAARVGIASSRSVFFTALESDASSKGLLTHLAGNPRDADKVVTRLRSLANTNVDYRYQNPSDAALSAYAWALLGLRTDLGAMAAEIILSAPQIWWARLVAATILNQNAVSDADTDTRITTLVSYTAETPYAVSAYVPVEQTPTFVVAGGLIQALEAAALVIPNSVTNHGYEWTLNPANLDAGGMDPVVVVKNPYREEERIPARLVA